MQMQDIEHIGIVHNFQRNYFQENISLEEVAALVFMAVLSLCFFF